MDNKLNKQIPYNTGKVLIGVHYEPPKPEYMNQENEHWQNVLTGVYQKRRANKMQFILYVAVLVGIFMLLGVYA